MNQMKTSSVKKKWMEVGCPAIQGGAGYEVPSLEDIPQLQPVIDEI